MATNHSDGGPPAPGRTELPWHPLLITAAIVISFWLDTVVSPYAAFRSLLVGIVGALVVAVALSLVLRDRHRGGVAATLLIAAFYSKHAVDAVADLAPRMGWGVAALWIGLMLLALVLAVRIGWRWVRRWNGPRTTAVLNRVGVILLVSTLGLGALGGKFQRAVADLDQGMSLDEASARGAASAPEDAPDIFVILLDGYPRADVLDFAFDFDNSAFTDELEERGFEVAGDSHSDYIWTHVTLPSLLSMAYVEDIPGLQDVMTGRAPLHPTLREIINDSAAFELASERGYTTVAVGAGFEQLALRQADVYVDGGQMNEFELKLFASTYLGDVVSVVAPDLASAQHRDRIEHGLSALGEIAALDGPMLAFAHIPSPHQPIVFGPGGSPVARPLNSDFYNDAGTAGGISPDAFVAAYRHHLAHLNVLVLDAVDQILAEADEPPVIVLMSDHGSASRVDWISLEPEDAAPDLLLERTGSLFAALTPEQVGVFPDDVSPVDVFRHLYDAYLGTAYGPALPPADGGQIAPVDASVLSAQ